MDSEPLTDADREYAAAWCKARGKRPVVEVQNGVRWWVWNECGYGDDPSDQSRLEWPFYESLDTDGEYVGYSYSEADAFDALAFVLRDLRRAASIPEAK